ncbi:hypothetical protein A3Q56_06237, partial [Intoshia linei]
KIDEIRNCYRQELLNSLASNQKKFNSKYLKQINDLKEKLKSKTDNYNELQQKYIRESGDNRKDIENFKNEIEELKKTIETKNILLEKLNTESEKELLIKELNENIVMMNDKINELNRTIEILKDKLVETESTLKITQDEYDKLQELMDSRMKNQKNQLLLLDQLKEKNDIIEELKLSLEEAKLKISDFEEEIIMLKELNQENIIAFENKIKTLNSEKKTLKTSLIESLEKNRNRPNTKKSVEKPHVCQDKKLDFEIKRLKEYIKDLNNSWTNKNKQLQNVLQKTKQESFIRKKTISEAAQLHKIAIAFDTSIYENDNEEYNEFLSYTVSVPSLSTEKSVKFSNIMDNK